MDTDNFYEKENPLKNKDYSQIKFRHFFSSDDMKLFAERYYNAKINDFNPDNNRVLSDSIFQEYGFHKIELEDSPFDDYKMPYYVKDGVILFYNTGAGNEHSFYIGYGENRFNKYIVVPFRWIHYEKELLEIYKSIRGFNLLKINK